MIAATRDGQLEEDYDTDGPGVWYRTPDPGFRTVFPQFPPTPIDFHISHSVHHVIAVIKLRHPWSRQLWSSHD